MISVDDNVLKQNKLDDTVMVILVKVMIRICSSIIDFGMHTDITKGKPDFTNLDEVVAEIDA